MSSNSKYDPSVSILDVPLPNSREVCFEQGKAFVYMREGDDEHVWAEWPNGTVDYRNIATGRVYRAAPGREFEEVDCTQPVPPEFLEPARSTPPAELDMTM